MYQLNLVPEGDEEAVAKVDASCKEKFRWAWLDKTVTLKLKDKNGEDMNVEKKLREFIVKGYTCGVCMCKICGNKSIKHANRGITSITDHVKTPSHIKKVNIDLQMYV